MSWELHLAIRLDGLAIGMQDSWATDFTTVRSVETGSWIVREHQGKGHGTESRAAVLVLVFGHLRALEAYSERVSRKLGYVYDGRRVYSRLGRACVVTV